MRAQPDTNTRVPMSDVQLAGLRLTAATQAWNEHITFCDSVQNYSQPCSTCWALDRAADDAAHEYARQRHLARRARLSLISVMEATA